jgi:hypothetical protein
MSQLFTELSTDIVESIFEYKELFNTSAWHPHRIYLQNRLFVRESQLLNYLFLC